MLSTYTLLYHIYYKTINITQKHLHSYIPSRKHKKPTKKYSLYKSQPSQYTVHTAASTTTPSPHKNYEIYIYKKII